MKAKRPIKHCALWAFCVVVSGAVCSVWDQEVAGSNPVIPIELTSIFEVG
jgi:hypothetical protein